MEAMIQKLLVLLLSVTCCCALTAESGSDLRNRLQLLDDATRLDDGTLKPWYLKVNFTLFDDAGKQKDQGTLEEWWVAPDERKIVVTSATYNATLLWTKGGRFQTKKTGPLPYALETMERQYVHPLPRAEEVVGLTPVLMKADERAPKADCIMYQGNVTFSYSTIGLFPTVCLDPRSGSLRSTFDFATLSVVRESMAMFQHRVTPIDIKVSFNQAQTIAGHVDVLTGHLTALATMHVDSAAFWSPSNDMVPAETRLVKFADTNSDRPAAIFPPLRLPIGVDPAIAARPVTFVVRIGTDGYVRSVRLLSAPNVKLAIAALNATVNTKWELTVREGKPVEVEEEVSLYFRRTAGL